MGKQAGGGNPFGNDLRRHRSRLDSASFGLNAFAGLTGVFVANVADNLKFGRNVIELL